MADELEKLSCKHLKLNRQKMCGYFLSSVCSLLPFFLVTQVAFENEQIVSATFWYHRAGDDKLMRKIIIMSSKQNMEGKKPPLSNSSLSAIYSESPFSGWFEVTHSVQQSKGLVVLKMENNSPSVSLEKNNYTNGRRSCTVNKDIWALILTSLITSYFRVLLTSSMQAGPYIVFFFGNKYLCA